jgi:signal transduction histidine kinase
VTYYEIQDYEKALYYAKKMIAIGGDPFGIDELSQAFGYYLVAMVQERLGKPDSALVNLAQSEALFKLSGGKSRYLGLAWIERVWPGLYNTRAKAHLQKGMYDEALKDLFWVFSNTEKNYEHFHSSNTYNDIALYYRTLGLRDSAVYYAEKALEEADIIDYTQAQLAASKMLAEEYERKNPVKALQYFKLANEFQNRLFGAGNVTIIREMIEKDEQRRQELADSEEEFRNRQRTNIFLGSSFTLFAITALVFWNSRQQRKSKRRIEIAYNRLKNTQSQLIQSEKMASLGELTAGIAHEIQNPLNFVNNFSEVNRELIEELKDAVASNDQDEIREILKDLAENEEKVKHHGRRAEGIVKGMLQHSRTSQGEKEPTDLNALADEYLRLAYHGLRAKDKSFNADFKTDFDPSLPKVNVVPQDIGRVLLNLINNAFQAVGEVDNPMVVVSTKKLDKQIEIKVSDNGPGIPEEIKDKIFQPFFTTKPTGQGTGLGLSLSYDIVKGHGGTFTLDTSVLKGAAFIIQFPINSSSNP